jgi:geranylgeranyl transferase type-2 subunit beta
MLVFMYLLQLADRVASGLRRLPPGRLELHRGFVLDKQTAEGGFPGREGGADLYYTGFAVRALAVTGGLPDGCIEPLAGWLSASSLLQLNAIDLLSWLYSALVVQASGGPDLLADQPSDLPDQLITSLLTLRTADGGFAKSSEGALGSTYQSFLVALIFEMLGRAIPRRNQLVQFLYDRQRDDGGFVEIAPMRRSGTNPTAAAVALLSMLNALDADISADVAGFLSDVAGGEGGFQANTRVPFADGLSTFTGLLTAQNLGFRDILPRERILNYVAQQLEWKSGGFRGASWDQQLDVEYTFYGLGILGLLHS